MNLRGAIFDMDGTLLDSMGIWEGVGSDYLRARGYTPEPGLDPLFKDMSLPQAARHFQKHYGITDSEEAIIAGINAIVEHYYLHEAPVKADAARLLAELEGQGVKMCLATATDRYLVEAALERCGLRRYFSEIFTCSAVGHGKDEPIIYRLALEHLGTEKSETMIFEDAVYALRTAHAEGIAAAGIWDRHEPWQEEVRRLSAIYLPENWTMEQFRRQLAAL